MSVNEQLQAFHAVDQELLGSVWGQGLQQPEILLKLSVERQKVQAVLQRGGTVMVTGAGTSGRLALMAASTFGGPGKTIHGVMAGGKGALIKAKEGAEDHPSESDLANGLLADVWIGVSCGLSAPYVLRQAQHRLEHGMACTLIGFNTVDAMVAVNKTAKNAGVDLDELVKFDDMTVINPLIGPEGLTGSTRLKSGTATWIIFAWLFAEEQPDVAQIGELIDSIYVQSQEISGLIQKAGSTLRQRQSIVYWSEPAYGLLALTDASECGPTFGANFDDVRAFVRGGWPALGWQAQGLMGIDQKLGSAFLNQQDSALRVRLGNSEMSGYLMPEAPSHFQAWERICWMKVNLNLLTTLAHVASGKVYGNLMIDLRISNRKLWYRAIGIISKIGQVRTDVAEQLLRQVVGADSTAHVDVCLQLAASLNLVVPTVILMARMGLSQSFARARLTRYTKLVDALK